MIKSQIVVDEYADVEILSVGGQCPNCGFAKLIEEGRQVLCPLCNYAAVKNT